jgi:hypothetical protein
MIELIRTTEKAKSDVRNILVNSLEAIEPGLEMLDLDLKLDETLTVEFLARGSDRQPAIVMLEETVPGGEALHKLLLILRKLRQNSFFLDRIYEEHLFDFSVSPRVFLLAPGMDDDFVACLETIGVTEIIPCEYSFLNLEDREYFTVNRKSGDKAFRAARIDGGKSVEKKNANVPEPTAARMTATPPSSPFGGQKPVAPAVEPEGKNNDKGGGDGAPSDFFQVAREKIKRITPKMTESKDGNLTRFKIDNRILTSLAIQSNACYVFLGDKKDKAIKITSDKVLNETLNQIYKLYITQFGPARTT